MVNYRREQVEKEGKAVTVPEKLSKALLDFRQISPYYSAIYQGIAKEPDSSVELLSITSDKILYHQEAVDAIPYEELLFWILHSISHLALGHLLRRGGRDRDLWNLACDFYVNRLLAEQFHFSFLGERVNYKGVFLTMPEHIPFSADLNLETDFVEAIYQKLHQKLYIDHGIEGQVEEMQQPKEENAGGASEESSWKSQWDENERSTHPTCSHSLDFMDADEHENTSFLSEIADKDFSQWQNRSDILDGMENQLEKQRKMDKILGQAQITTALQQKEAQFTLGQPLLPEMVAQIQTPPVPWKQVLRRYLRVAQEKESSFSHPDPRFYYQNRILPGEWKGELDGLQGLKLCLDTSGSISSEELEEFTAHLWTICKEFHLEGELIYWDSIIEHRQPFQGKGDLSLFHSYSGQGTKPDCLFSYFESKECKVKPVVTLIFTDGLFPIDYGNQRRKKQFQNTLWIISEDKPHQPAFGRVVKSVGTKSG